MAKTLTQLAGSNSGITQGTTVYSYGASDGFGGVTTTTESQRQVTWRTVGVMSNIYINVVNNTVTASSTFKSRKNGGDGAMSVSIPSSTTGEFEDTTNTDSIADGDEWCLSVVVGAGGTSLAPGVSSFIFDAVDSDVRTGKSVKKYGGIGGGNLTGPNNRYPGFCTNVISSTESTAAVRFRTPALMRDLFYNVATNARSSTTTLRTRVNGGNGNQSLSVGSGATGIFEDNSNTDTIAVGDDFNFITEFGAGTGNLAARLGIECETTNGQWMLVTGHTSNTTADTHAPVEGYHGTSGFAESVARGDANIYFYVSDMNCKVSASSSSATTNVNFKKNNSAVSGKQISIGAGLTGLFEDNGDFVSVVPNDALSHQIDRNDANSMTFHGIGLLCHDRMPKPVGNIMMVPSVMRAATW